MDRKKTGNAPNRKRSVVLISGASILVLCATAAIALKIFLTGLYDPAPIPAASDAQERTVLCLGDSLTRGNCSANYVEELSSRFDGEGIRVVNAGINGDMVHDVLIRLNGVLAASGAPDVITVLIGTNDANATLDPNVAKRAIENPAMGRIPIESVYRTKYPELIGRLREASDAPIIIVSIPPIGEVPGSPEWTRSAEYAAADKDIAIAENCAYVPFFEILAGLIEADPPDPSAFQPHAEWSQGMRSAVFKRHILGRDYEEIGADSGYLFHSDQLHLNEKGALVLADALEREIRKALAEK